MSVGGDDDSANDPLSPSNYYEDAQAQQGAGTSAAQDPAAAWQASQQAGATTVAPTDDAPSYGEALANARDQAEQQAQAQIDAWQQAQADAYDPSKATVDPNAPAVGFSPISASAAAKPESAVLDFARQTWISTLQMGRAVIGAASFAANKLGADPATVEHIENVKADVADYAASQLQALSPKAQAAMSASIFGGKEPDGTSVPTPGSVGWSNYVGATIASMVPQAVLAVVPGGIVGSVVSKLAIGAIGAGEGAAAAAGTAARIATTAGGFGALDAGQAYNDMAQQIDDASTKTLMQSPVYAHAVQTGLSDEDARKTLLSAIAPTLVAAHFASGAAAGAAGGELVSRGAVGAIGKGLMGRAALGAGEGAAAMGVQAAGDNAADQNANQALGQQKSFDPEQMALAFAKGAIGGAVIGGVGGVIHGTGTDDGAPLARTSSDADETSADENLADENLADETSADENLAAVPPVPDDVKEAMQNVLPPDTSGPKPITVNPAQAGDQPSVAAPAPAASPPQPAPVESAAPQPVQPPSASAAPGSEPGASAPAETAPPGNEALAAAQPVTVAPSTGTPPAPPERPTQAAPPAEATPSTPPAAPQSPVEAAAAQTNPNPTPEQAASGDYQKGSVDVGGLPVSIETPRGATRTGIGEAGKQWAVTMPDHYGYIEGTKAADGDGLDVTLGPHADQAQDHPVFVINQVDPKTRKFDEHKAFVGFPDKAAAIASYDKSFSDGSGPKRRMSNVAEMPFDQFKQFAQGDLSKPVKGMPANRLLQKQKLAPLGAPVEARAAVAMGEAPEVEAHAPGVAIPHKAIADTLKATVVPLKKGADITPHIQRITKELEGLMQLKDTDGGLHYGSGPEGTQALLRDWAQAHPGKIPGTRTNTGDFADALARKMNGEGIIKGEGAAAEVAAQPVRVEKDGVGQESDDEANPTVAEGGEMTGELGEESHAAPVEETGPVTEAAPAPTRGLGTAGSGGKVREIERLHQRVLDGEMTPHEAEEAYAKPANGERRGKPRSIKSYADYLTKKIAEARDPAREHALLLEGHRIEQDKTLSPQARAESTKRINRLLDSTGEEHAQRLEAIRDELLDPVGAATGHDYFLESSKRPQALPPSSSRYVSVTRDPRLSAPIMNAMEASERYHAPFTSHDALRQIIGSPLVRAEAPPLHALAKRLLDIAPDIPVMSHDYANEAGYRVPDLDPSRYRGAMVSNADGSPSHIILQGHEEGQFSQPLETVLHEVMHSVTAPMIRKVSADQTHPITRALGAMRRELARQFPDHSLFHEEGEDPQAIEHAAKDAHELHTMLMTNPTIQAMASRVEASPHFLQAMRDSGLPLHGSGRTVWKAFVRTMRRVLGLGDAASASEHTLLDHLLRASHQITDEAAKYNRAMSDPVVRGMAEPLLRATGVSVGKSGKDAVTRALGHVDWGALGDKARKALLMGANTDAIIRWNRDLFKPTDRIQLRGNPLDRFRRAMEDTAHVTKLAHDGSADLVNRLLERVNGMAKPEQDKLGRLMNDATLAGVRLGHNLRPDANDHIEDKAYLGELQARYDSMSPKARDTYQALKDLYSTWHRRENKAALGATMQMVLPNATDAQKTELRKALSSRKAIDDFIKSGDNNPVAAAFGNEWANNRAIVHAVAAVQAKRQVPGDYFPLKRFGNYVVRYGSGDTYGLEMFDRKDEAVARHAELAKAGVEDLMAVQAKRESKLPGPSIMHTDVRALRDAVERVHGPKVAQSVVDMINTDILEHMRREAAATTRLRRKGIQGASIDLKRVLAKEFVGHGVRMGHISHDGDRADALSDMGLVVKDLAKGAPGEQIRAQAVLNELERRSAVGDNSDDVLSGVARKASSLGYVQSLMSFSHALTSALETHMISASTLGARHGALRAGVALTKALADVTPKLAAQGAAMTFKAMGKGLKAADWNLSQVAKERLIAAGANAGHMNKLFAAADNAGLIDHTMEREMQRIAGGYGQSALGTGWQRFVDLNAAGAHASDIANKSAVLKAAFDLEYAKTRDVDTAVAYAVRTLRDAAPNHNLGNKARITTSKGPLGGFAAPLTQFKQYGIHMYGLLANLTRESLHGASDAEKWEARKALAGVLATHALMAGGLTLIADPLRYIGGAYDFATGAPQPHDYQNDVRGWLSDTFGPELGMVMARGLPYLAGIDIHRRVGLDNMLAVPEISAFTGPAVLQALASAMTGAAGEDASNMVGGLGQIAQGNLFAGLQALVPRVLRDPMKAIKLNDQGVTDTKGNTILPPSRLAPTDVAAQALGFQPADVSEFREGRYAVIQAQQEMQSQRAALSHAWVSAAPTDRGAVMTEIRLWNQAHPTQRITVGQLLQEAHRATKSAPGKIGAFGLPAKDPASAGRFANY